MRKNETGSTVLSRFERRPFVRSAKFEAVLFRPTKMLVYTTKNPVRTEKQAINYRVPFLLDEPGVFPFSTDMPASASPVKIDKIRCGHDRRRQPVCRFRHSIGIPRRNDKPGS